MVFDAHAAADWQISRGGAGDALFPTFLRVVPWFPYTIEEPYAICAAYLLLERNGELEYAHRQYTDLRRAMSAPGRG